MNATKKSYNKLTGRCFDDTGNVSTNSIAKLAQHSLYRQFIASLFYCSFRKGGVLGYNTHVHQC